jgi:hypothetical protein
VKVHRNRRVAIWQYGNIQKSTALNEEEDDHKPTLIAISTAILEQYQVGTLEHITMDGNANGGGGLRLNEDRINFEFSPATAFDDHPLAFDDMFEVKQVVACRSISNNS